MKLSFSTSFPALILSALGASFSCALRPAPQPLLVAAHNNHIQYMGRTGSDSNATLLYWSGSSALISFEGTAVAATLKDEKGENYFYTVIDGQPAAVKLNPDTTMHTYTLAQLPPGRHTVQLYKLTEGTMGKTWFYGFQLSNGGKVLPPPPLPAKNIEFYGNSITSGYSLEDTVGDAGAPQYFNNYLSYAAITARHYHAGYHCISKSGIGLMLSWFPVIMPELYDRTCPADTAAKWDFSRYQPGLVVVNLLQNDSWLVHKPQHPQFIARFGTTPPSEDYIINAYRQFIAGIRGHYPRASILCILGSMDATKPGSPWPGYIQKAVEQLHDPNVYTHFFAYKNTPGHPKAKEHEAMAAELEQFIDAHIQW